MPTITIRIRLDYAWDKSLHVQKMRVPALQTLADAPQMFRAVISDVSICGSNAGLCGLNSVSCTVNSESCGINTPD